jgi:hypothetical protein
MEALVLEQRLLVERLRWWRSQDEIIRLTDELHAVAKKIAVFQKPATVIFKTSH